jgi:hypothetical protein
MQARHSAGVGPWLGGLGAGVYDPGRLAARRAAAARRGPDAGYLVVVQRPRSDSTEQISQLPVKRAIGGRSANYRSRIGSTPVSIRPIDNPQSRRSAAANARVRGARRWSRLGLRMRGGRLGVCWGRATDGGRTAPGRFGIQARGGPLCSLRRAVRAGRAGCICRCHRAALASRFQEEDGSCHGSVEGCDATVHRDAHGEVEATPDGRSDAPPLAAHDDDQWPAKVCQAIRQRRRLVSPDDP